MTVQSIRCTATARTGRRCRNRAILGATVCRMHGGSAPQVRRAAEERLRELVHPALDRITELLDTEDEALRLRVATTILDRTGFHPSHGLELSGRLAYDELTDEDLAAILLDEPAVLAVLADTQQPLPDRSSAPDATAPGDTEGQEPRT